MRFLVRIVMLSFALASAAAHADPDTKAGSRRGTAEASSPVHVGAALHWTPKRLGHHVGLGLGWTFPQRWYDVDGQLLTGRSLLHPGDDLERSGLYLALRF